MKIRNALVVITICFVVAVLDAFFKLFAIRNLSENASLKGIIDFALHKNPGIAFDIPIPLSIVVVVTAIITIILIRLIIKSWRTNKYSSVSAIAIVFGALGNMVDRIINGFTTDYIIILGTSAINLSDILIVAGAISLLYYNEYKNK